MLTNQTQYRWPLVVDLQHYGCNISEFYDENKLCETRFKAMLYCNRVSEILFICQLITSITVCIVSCFRSYFCPMTVLLCKANSNRIIRVFQMLDKKNIEGSGPINEFSLWNKKERFLVTVFLFTTVIRYEMRYTVSNKM